MLMKWSLQNKKFRLESDRDLSQDVTYFHIVRNHTIHTKIVGCG